jgi:hypothetical protein
MRMTSNPLIVIDTVDSPIMPREIGRDVDPRAQIIARRFSTPPCQRLLALAGNSFFAVANLDLKRSETAIVV